MYYTAALSYFSKINRRRYEQLMSHFSTDASLFEASHLDFIEAGLPEALARELHYWCHSISVETITNELVEAGITPLIITDPTYPRLLREIPDAPVTLFVRGQLGELRAVAIVGTRRVSPYGKECTRQISNELANLPISIVSGLAFGVDAIAHEQTLEAGGHTIAVLGSGIDEHTVYPAAHRRLAEKIITSGGALVSEYPPGFKPTTYSFPARNRIIAGLSSGTLVTEAPISSGALITARHALEYNRDVFALPHPITSETGQGCNNLIKMGAILVTHAADIAHTYSLEIAAKTQTSHALSANESLVTNSLRSGGTHVDQIAAETKLGTTVVMSTLSLLEMRGVIKNCGGMRYSKV